jgi:hypothetical protein
MGLEALYWFQKIPSLRQANYALQVKIASGGELSALSLAIQMAIGFKASALIVFDGVWDSGINLPEDLTTTKLQTGSTAALWR